MSDTVKLIIEIPKNYLETIKHTVRSTAENGNTPLVFEIIVNGIPLDDDSERAEVQAYFDGEAYGWEQGRKALLDDVKAEFIKLYPKNYMGEPSFGGMFCNFSLCKVLEILDNIGKAEKGGEGADEITVLDTLNHTIENVRIRE